MNSLLPADCGVLLSLKTDMNTNQTLGGGNLIIFISPRPRQKILRAFDRLLQAAEKFAEVGIAVAIRYPMY